MTEETKVAIKLAQEITDGIHKATTVSRRLAFALIELYENTTVPVAAPLKEMI